MLEEAERDLGATGVVDAEEQHDGYAVVAVTFDPCECREALPREPLASKGRKFGDRAARGELVVGGVQEPFESSRPYISTNRR